jgi:hypothetical protein
MDASQSAHTPTLAGPCKNHPADVGGSCPAYSRLFNHQASDTCINTTASDNPNSSKTTSLLATSTHGTTIKTKIHHVVRSSLQKQFPTPQQCTKQFKLRYFTAQTPACTSSSIHCHPCSSSIGAAGLSMSAGQPLLKNCQPDGECENPQMFS